MSYCSTDPILTNRARPVDIERTKGVWIRHNVEKEELELYIDGDFKASWNGPETPRFSPVIYGNIARRAYLLGKEEGHQENKKLVRQALGID